MEKSEPGRSGLSHLDDAGRVRMVDVSSKGGSLRLARAQGTIHMSVEALSAVAGHAVPKGNVLTTAQLAGIQAAKRTADLIPLCHPLSLAWVDVAFEIVDGGIEITSQVKALETTGLEMEALTAVSVAALTIYDMCKSMDREMTIGDIRLLEKRGGKSDAGPAYRPKAAVVVISDSVAAGERQDRSGAILRAGLEEAGCPLLETEIVPDEAQMLRPIIEGLVESGAELILTTGGTGLGPRDITTPAVEPLLTGRLPGVEQALHAYGRQRLRTAMLSRLLAGNIGDTIIVCLPGSDSAARDGLKVLLPAIFHAFEVQHGAGHDRH